jgi:hypothetical protein
MPPQSSIIVCKPQIHFSQRLVDSDLRRLTVAQLRKKARENGLDVRRLTEKWEFVHVLVQHRTHGVQVYPENVTDTKRRTIFELPGEIRNKIYSFVLVADDPIVAQYQFPDHSLMARHRQMMDSLKKVPKLDQNPPNFTETTSQLLKMSWANRELRKEARGFFFSHNRFEVRGNNGSSHLNFLNDIGPDGRANLTTLNLDSTDFDMYNVGFLPILCECTSLGDLTIRMHLGHILKKDSYAEVRNYVEHMNNAWHTNGRHIEISSAIDVFTRLPALRVLKVNCAHHGQLFASWIYNWTTAGWISPSSDQEKVEGEVLNAAKLALENAMEGRDVEITVSMIGGAP